MKKILIVDDNSDTVEYASSILAKFYEVQVAYDGREASKRRLPQEL